jgi:hypothetical protein
VVDRYLNAACLRLLAVCQPDFGSMPRLTMMESTSALLVIDNGTLT